MTLKPSYRIELPLLLLTFFVSEVTCRGSRGGSGIGDAIGNSFSSLNFFSPTFAAGFAITVIVAIITFFQFALSAIRLKQPILPENEPALPYDIGKLFRILRFSYLFVYLVSNILSAIFIAGTTTFEAEPVITFGDEPGFWFVGQLADVLFLSMLLSILTYRERIQLNPTQKVFNIKSFLDGWLMTVILILGIAEDAVFGSLIQLPDANIDEWAAPNLALAYDVLFLFGCIYVAATAIMAHIRLRKSGIDDKIVRMTALYITPFIVLGGAYHVIDDGLGRSENINTTESFVEGMFIARIVILDLVAVVVAGLTLLMGAPPKPSKGNGKTKN